MYRIDEIIRLAAQRHHSGELVRAEQLYRLVLDKKPEQPPEENHDPPNRKEIEDLHTLTEQTDHCPLRLLTVLSS